MPRRKTVKNLKRPSIVRERLKDDRRRAMRALSPSERLETALEISELCRTLRKAVRTAKP